MVSAFLWQEGEGGVISNEFATILYDFVDNKLCLIMVVAIKTEKTLLLPIFIKKKSEVFSSWSHSNRVWQNALENRTKTPESGDWHL